jgi:hypothetical protein
MAPSQSSRADQKFEKKLQFYAKVRDTVNVLSATKAITKPKTKLRSRQKKLKAYDLSTLSDFLPDLKARNEQPIVAAKVNSKSRQKIVTMEEGRMKAVLNHPAFQANPLAAIHEHLLSTQPAMDVKVVRKDNKKMKNKKKKKSKKSVGVQSMEI